ncbi:alternative ribosome rescue aminoacyl-tRNA hydrolase ArfB [Piscinibacter sakaiensis]|uniref:alternative ribosome rescue aminoacyl-tRNA hydrolase ArfB n=1 Tax=Piscinibacter sakaiensis TaxID=1547922 RepID=UPI003AAACBDF
MSPAAEQRLRALLAAESTVSAVRAQGPGGQNVNKVSSAIHLRFDIGASSLPDDWKERLRAVSDQRINADGIVVIKAQSSRSREANLADALQRLFELVAAHASAPRVRRATRPTFGSKLRRLESKSQRSAIKAGRGKVAD